MTESKMRLLRKDCKKICPNILQLHQGDRVIGPFSFYLQSKIFTSAYITFMIKKIKAKTSQKCL